jgi:hypothetical protein
VWQAVKVLHFLLRAKAYLWSEWASQAKASLISRLKRGEGYGWLIESGELLRMADESGELLRMADELEELVHRV